MRRVLSLVAVVVLAGCLGATTPASTPEPPDATWTDGDSINTTSLADRHFERLRAAGSFTTNHSETVRVDGASRPDGPRPEGYHPPNYARKQVDLDSGRYLDTFVTVGHRRSNHFVTPEVTARRHRDCPDCEYEYSYGHRPEGDTLSKRIDRYRRAETVDRFARSLRGVTVGFDYSYAGTVQRDGETLYRYRADQRLDTAPPPFAGPPNVTATLLVTGDGVVRRFELRYEGSGTVTVDGENRTVPVTHTFVRTYAAVGETTVDRPAWVDRAADSDPPRTTATGGE